MRYAFWLLLVLCLAAGATGCRHTSSFLRSGDDCGCGGGGGAVGEAYPVIPSSQQVIVPTPAILPSPPLLPKQELLPR